MILYLVGGLLIIAYFMTYLRPLDYSDFFYNKKEKMCKQAGRVFKDFLEYWETRKN